LVKVPQNAPGSFLDISHLLTNSVLENEELPKIIDENIMTDKKAD
jgi:hypothetical protein